MLANTETSVRPDLVGGSNWMPPPVPAAVLLAIVLVKMWT